MGGAGRRIGAALDGALAWSAGAWWRQALLTLVVGLAVLAPGTASLPVTDRDEARFAQASKQMLETGDLVDIRFQDAPRWKKPVAIYWLQAGSAAAFGGGGEAGIWAYRLPSLFGAILAAVLLGWAARPLIGPAAASLAGLLLATTLLVAVEANIAKTDAVLMATAVVAMGALARCLLWTRPPRLTDALLFWSALGIAILVKGPIVPAIAALAIVWIGLAERRLPRLGRLRPLIGLPLLAAIVLPWLIAIAIVSEGAFFAASVGDDMLSKVAAGQEAHGAPPGYYTIALFGTFWPWAAFLPLALPWAWRHRHTTAMRFLAGWTIPFWLLLELVPTKLPHYVLPLYPALAAILAAWLMGPARRDIWAAWQRVASAVLFALPALAGAVAAVALPLLVEGRVVWGAVALAALAVPFGILATRAAWAGHPTAQAGAGILTAACLYPALLAFALPGLDTAFISPRLAAAQAPWEACASGPAASAGYREPSLVFLTDTALGMPETGDAAARLAADPGALVWVEERVRADLDAALPTGTGLVTRATVEGFNYNRGRMTRIDLLTPDDPRWETCTR